MKMFGLYIGIFQLVYLSEPEETPNTTEEKIEEPAPLIAEATIDEIIKPELKKLIQMQKSVFMQQWKKQLIIIEELKKGKEN